MEFSLTISMYGFHVKKFYNLWNYRIEIKENQSIKQASNLSVCLSLSVLRSFEILAAFAWSNLETQRNQQKSLLMYKILKGIAPGYLRELFTHVNEDNEYNLRSSDINVKIPQPYTEYLKRSLSYDGAALWNSLPNSIQNVYSTDISKFNYLMFIVFNIFDESICKYRSYYINSFHEKQLLLIDEITVFK